MAFPQIASVTISHSLDAAETSIQVDYPASGISAGDLLIAIVSNDGSGDVLTWPAGDWADNALFAPVNANSHGRAISYIFAAGTENGSSFTATHPSEGSAALLLHITGAHASQAPEIGTMVSETGDDWPATTVTASWGAEDNLFIGVITNDDSTDAITGYPTELPDNQTYSGVQVAGISGVAIASDEQAAATYSNTDTVNIRTSATGAYAGMMVVRPAAAVSGRILGSLAGEGGLSGHGGIAGRSGGIAG